MFDIAGPVMVGPSSSHTAGACKIGQFARALFHRTPTKITFYLHGSFGQVYKGHATDRALLAGIMKFRTSDPRIKDSFKIADEKGMKYEFIPKELGAEYHPNTVKIVLEDGNKHKMSVVASSVGGGLVEIIEIDKFKVHLRGRAGKYLSLIVFHDKNKGVLEKLRAEIKKLKGLIILSEEQDSIDGKAITVLNLRGRRIKLPEVVALEKNIEGVDFVRSLSKLEKQ